ncbi:hypothetical protein R1flu_005770 [Riccia fluitans]|uniref:Major facilitator superfamily (MFS) profile domain-containing protein n=1 Tax=Riccia fluitans TaxID=41844 RepID=A0ABD1YU47_9MARC
MAGISSLSCATASLSLPAPTASGGNRRGTKTESKWGRSSCFSASSQSSWCSSSYGQLRREMERAVSRHLTTSQNILNFSRKMAFPRVTVPCAGLAERITSSQFCSCSRSSSSSTTSACNNSGGLSVYGGIIITGIRYRRKSLGGVRRVALLTGTSLHRVDNSRRRDLDLFVVRSQQSQSENVDIGKINFDSLSNAGEGETSSIHDSLELNSLASKIVGTSGAGLSQEIDVAKAQTWFDSVPKRWVVVILCFFSFLLCNMDRVNMSIAIMPMAAEFGWSPTTVGLVQSSFFWGYLLTQIAGGVWADKLGGKQVLGFGVVWWSLATVATPLAAKLGLPALFFVRACMGVGEGVAMPAMNNLLSRWVPVEERSRSLALVYSGMYLGSVIGLAFSPSLIHAFGWPSVFISFGSLGAIWLTFWQRLAYSSPAEHPTISDEEATLILKDNKPRDPLAKIPWRLLLSKAPVWALIISHFCHNWGTFILLTWMPTYYNQVLGFNLMESGLFSVLPWLTMAFSANVGGWIADTLVSKGYSVTFVRKLMQSIGFLGPAFFLTQLSKVTSPSLAVLCMMCSQGLDAFSQSGLYSNHQDIGPRYSGILLGMSNTAGVLAGVFGTAATGYILQHGSWDDVFKVAVGLYLLGTVVWNVFATGEKQFD